MDAGRIAYSECMDSRTHRRLLRQDRPRSLSGLMSLYESSYARLQRLLPFREVPFDDAISRSELDNDLHLKVLERCKFTTTLHLTYWFETKRQALPDPDLTVRVYYDTGQVEALHCNQHPRCVALRDFDYHEHSVLDAQWGRNLMLNKWLAFLLEHGHGFVQVQLGRSD